MSFYKYYTGSETSEFQNYFLQYTIMQLCPSAPNKQAALILFTYYQNTNKYFPDIHKHFFVLALASSRYFINPNTNISYKYVCTCMYFMVFTETCFLFRYNNVGSWSSSSYIVRFIVFHVLHCLGHWIADQRGFAERIFCQARINWVT